jgi:excisionase family DNA binding protein
MKLLDMGEVAKRLGCCKGHVSKLINGKVKGLPKLPCIRLGRRTMVSEDALNEWLHNLQGRGAA